MENGYLNHDEVAPAITSGVYQYEDPEHNMGYEVLNQIGPMHYGGVGNSHIPTLYEPSPFFPHPSGYMDNPYQYEPNDATMSAANFMPHSPQFNCAPHPLLHRSLRFEENMPAAYHSQDSGGLYAYTFMENALQDSTTNNTNWVDGSVFHPVHQSNDYRGRIFTNDEGDFLTGSQCSRSPNNSNFSRLGHNMVDGYLSPGYNMDGWTWSGINDGITHGIYPSANSSQFDVLPMPNVPHYFPLPGDKIFVEGDKLDANINEDPYGCYQGFMAVSNHFSWNRAGLPNKNEAGMSMMHSPYTSGWEISDEQNCSHQRHGYKNTIGTSPSNLSMVSPKVRVSGSSRGEKQSGQPGQTQRSKPNQSVKNSAVPVKRSGIQRTSASKDTPPPTNRSGIRKTSTSKDPAPPTKRSVIQKTSAPRQVWRQKSKTQPFASRTKRSPEYNTAPIHHITFDGFDGQCELVGQNCDLCKMDLSCVPTDYEFEYHNEFESCNLPEVAVLPCGHTFHSTCLLFSTPEGESTDPPCFLCLSCQI